MPSDLDNTDIHGINGNYTSPSTVQRLQGKNIRDDTNPHQHAPGIIMGCWGRGGVRSLGQPTLLQVGDKTPERLDERRTTTHPRGVLHGEVVRGLASQPVIVRKRYRDNSITQDVNCHGKVQGSAHAQKRNDTVN